MTHTVHCYDLLHHRIVPLNVTRPSLTLTLAARLERIPVLEARPAVGTTRLWSDLSWVMMEPAPCEVTEMAKSSRV